MQVFDYELSWATEVAAVGGCVVSLCGPDYASTTTINFAQCDITEPTTAPVNDHVASTCQETHIFVCDFVFLLLFMFLVLFVCMHARICVFV